MKTDQNSKPIIVWVRHGQSEANVLNLLNSNPDSQYHLTELGRSQAENAGSQIQEIMNRLGIKKTSGIFTSPLVRAKETAGIISKHVSGKPIVTDLLIERQVGILEGKSESSRDWKLEPNKYGAEEFSHLKARASSFVKSLKGGGLFIAVTHKDLIIAAVGALENMNELQLIMMPSPTGSMTIIDYNANKILMMGETEIPLDILKR